MAAGLKLLPEIVTIVPAGPEIGVNEDTMGAGKELNVNPARLPVPYCEVTVTEPVDPPPTTAVIFVAELIVKEVAGAPPNLTPVAHVKFEPVIDTVVPIPPDVGVNADTTGVGGFKFKF